MISAVSEPGQQGDVRGPKPVVGGRRKLPAHISVYLFIIVPLVLIAVCACWWPARVAVRADPAVILRAE